MFGQIVLDVAVISVRVMDGVMMQRNVMPGMIWNAMTTVFDQGKGYVDLCLIAHANKAVSKCFQQTDLMNEMEMDEKILGLPVPTSLEAVSKSNLVDDVTESNVREGLGDSTDQSMHTISLQPHLT